MSEVKVVVALIIVTAIVFTSVGWFTGEDMARKTWQAECVKRGFAEYNKNTGEWQWKGENGKQE